MKSKPVILVLLTLIISNSLTAQHRSSHTSREQNLTQETAWVLHSECGVRFWMGLNLVVRDFPPSWRHVYVFVEPQNCTQENFRKIFFCLSEKELQPEHLIITVQSDKASLQKIIDRHLVSYLIQTDGSFVSKKYSLYRHGMRENEIGFYRAEYDRSEVVEQFSYSPDPNKPESLSVTLKRRLGIGAPGAPTFMPTGDSLLDLVLASQSGLEESIKKLLDNGTDVNGRTKHGNTPLLAAIRWRNSKIVNLLLERGANINQKDSDGWTPLMYSIINREYDEIGGIAEELLRRGADVNARAANGDSALLIAVERSQGMTRMVELLLRKGADASVRDKYGRTPLMIAEEGTHMDYIREMLKKAMTQK